MHIGRNNNGQALIEFVLILPIIIFLLLGMIDIGRILSSKNELENQITDIITLWEKENTPVSELEKNLKKENLDVKLFQNKNTSFVTVNVKKKISFITPFLKAYSINIKRVVPNE